MKSTTVHGDVTCACAVQTPCGVVAVTVTAMVCVVPSPSVTETVQSAAMGPMSHEPFGGCPPVMHETGGGLEHVVDEHCRTRTYRADVRWATHREVEAELAKWAMTWTTNGVNDTAIYVKPSSSTRKVTELRPRP